MQANLNDKLYEVAEEVFENLAFVLVMPGDDDDASAEETVAAGISFSGPFNGDLFVEVSSELLPLIGENMLGLDDGEPSEEDQKDAFKELVNVVCGNLLPAIAGARAVFDISPAEILAETRIPETHGQQEPQATARFALEVGDAKLALFADEEICVEETGDASSDVLEIAATEE